MEYDIDHDQSEADPKHCTAVLQQWKNELQSSVNDLIKQFEKRTDLRLKEVSFRSSPDCSGQETFTGINFQFDL